jgi:hypothetical protein
MNQNGMAGRIKKICAAGLLIAGSAVFADENDQVWMTGTVKYKLNDPVSIKFARQVRWKNEDHYYSHTDLGIGYALNKGWSVGGAFRYIEKKNKRGAWQSCDGYLLDLVHKAKGRGLHVKSRLRLSYFDPNYNADCSTDFRPRFDLSPANGFTEWKLKPYVADEVMFDVEEKNLYRNRLIVGLKAQPFKSLSLDIFVMQERTETGGDWAENWNSGLAATVSF